MTPKRGEIWWVNLDPTRGSEINKKRACVVLTSDIVNQRRRTIIVVPLSTAPIVRPPITVAVQAGGRSAIAVVDQVRATAKERFDSRIGSLSPEDLEAVEEALSEILQLL